MSFDFDLNLEDDCDGPLFGSPSTNVETFYTPTTDAPFALAAEPQQIQQLPIQQLPIQQLPIQQLPLPMQLQPMMQQHQMMQLQQQQMMQQVPYGQQQQKQPEIVEDITLKNGVTLRHVVDDAITTGITRYMEINHEIIQGSQEELRELMHKWKQQQAVKLTFLRVEFTKIGERRNQLNIEFEHLKKQQCELSAREARLDAREAKLDAKDDRLEREFVRYAELHRQLDKDRQLRSQYDPSSSNHEVSLPLYSHPPSSSNHEVSLPKVSLYSPPPSSSNHEVSLPEVSLYSPPSSSSHHEVSLPEVSLPLYSPPPSPSNSTHEISLPFLSLSSPSPTSPTTNMLATMPTVALATMLDPTTPMLVTSPPRVKIIKTNPPQVKVFTPSKIKIKPAQIKPRQKRSSSRMIIKSAKRSIESKPNKKYKRTLSNAPVAKNPASDQCFF